MSLPSDITSDVPIPDRRAPAGANSLNAQQVGLTAAAIVAFLGITYVGPAITRLTRKKSLRDRMQRRLRQTQRDVENAGRQTQKRVRQLGARSRRWI